jgi:ketosteroid isomerase-like protein
MMTGMTTPVDPAVQTLLDAANKNDLAAFLASFTDDGVVDDWGREFRGADRIKGWSDAEFIGKQVSLAVESVDERDGDVVVTAQVGGNGFNGPSHFAFRVDGGRVSRMTIRA